MLVLCWDSGDPISMNEERVVDIKATLVWVSTLLSLFVKNLLSRHFMFLWMWVWVPSALSSHSRYLVTVLGELMSALPHAPRTGHSSDPRGLSESRADVLLLPRVSTRKGSKLDTDGTLIIMMMTRSNVNGLMKYIVEMNN